MDDLVQWLGEQLDEDERIARRATVRQRDGGTWAYDGENVRAASGLGVASRIVPVHGEHVAEHDPARVLREIEAKRQLVERYERAMENRRAHPDDLASAGALLALHGAVKLLALPYADRPGYREEWRP